MTKRNKGGGIQVVLEDHLPFLCCWNEEKKEETRIKMGNKQEEEKWSEPPAS